MANPERATLAGSVFLWTRRGVPEAACSMYAYGDGERDSDEGEAPAVDHELVSLSTRSIAVRHGGESVWETEQPGITWRPLAGAPAPAAKRAARLAQSVSGN